MNSNDTVSYKVINDEAVDKSFLESTNIISCTIQNSIFTETNFKLSDFDGTILVQCKFIIGDWSQTDCCSLTVADTLFQEIDFTFSTMRDCDFKNCTFVDCKFDHIALSESRFEQCTFENIHITVKKLFDSYVHCCIVTGHYRIP